MARGRMISKSLSTSARFATLHQTAGKLAEFCQSLYPLLVAHADDWGCLPGDPFTIKHLVLPASPRTLAAFATALQHLHDVELVDWYEADDKRFLHIRQWSSHQQLHGHDHDGRKRNFPAPPEKPKHVNDFAQIRPDSPKHALREEKRTEEKRKEESSTSDAAIAAGPAATNEAEVFRVLWNETTTLPIPRCRDLTTKRRRHIRARLTERPLTEWREVMTRIQGSRFCRGEIPSRREGEQPWIVTFDWLIGSPDVAVKVLEGAYEDRRPPAKAVSAQREDWADECKRLHGGECLGQSAHRTRSVIEAGRAERASV